MTYSINIGPGEHARMALFLIRSIRRLQPQSTIIAYVAKEEREMIADDVMREVEQIVTTYHGTIPVDGYPISAKIAAMKTAAEMSNDEATVMLDSDILALKEPTLPDAEAELFVKPVDIAGFGVKQEVWEDVYATLDIPLPDSRTQSTVDKKEIFPYWNAGVVVSRNTSIPRRWLNATETLCNELDIQSRFIDQLALGAISTEFAVQPLAERHNFPLPHRLIVPNSTQFLHYHSYRYLRRVFDRKTRKAMKDIKMIDYLSTKRNSRLGAFRDALSSLANPCRRIIYPR